jgi:hypothetical protein
MGGADFLNLHAQFEQVSTLRRLDKNTAIFTPLPYCSKTTLINHILTGDHGKKIAVIENEFGKQACSFDQKCRSGMSLLESITLRSGFATCFSSFLHII